MRVLEKADIASLEPLLCSIQAGTAIIGRSERFIIDAIARGTLKAVNPLCRGQGRSVIP
jgi:hypothetical protein